MAKKIDKVQGQDKVLSRDEILKEIAGTPTRNVFVKGLNASIKMQNIDFEKLVEMRTECTDEKSYKAGLIACTCHELKLEDVVKLRNANGFKYAMLWAAVAEFHGLEALKDENLKN